MSEPLPGRWADELLWHKQNCLCCRMAKLAPSFPAAACARSQELIRLTIDERHGKEPQ